MSMEHIRNAYGVPAKRGGRVEYTHPQPARMGTIVGARNGRLSIKMDGDEYAGSYHPTWHLRYLDATGAQTSAGEQSPAGAHG